MTEALKSATTPDGVTLRYLDTGTGDPPMIFIHGWTCDHTHWRDQVPHFARSHRVVAVDLRGHGASDKPDQDYSIPRFVDDVAGLIRKLGLGKPVVIGHSMGGTIAMNLARKHTGLVRAIVMIDSPIAPLTDHLNPLVEQLLAGLQTPTYSVIAAGFVRMNMFNTASPAQLVEEIVADMAGAPQRVMHTALASTLAPESRAAGPIPLPALYIRAATNFASEEQLRQRFPGLEVTDVQAAHFLQMEKPQETNSIIGRFVDGLV